MAERPIRCRDIGTGHQFQCRRCAACEIERLSPRPAPEAIGAYYPTGYSPYRVRQETLGARVKRLAHDAWWASDNRFGALRPLLRALTYPVRGRPVLSFPAPRLRRVFEIGAASGNDLADFREAGWEVSGCEPSAHACALAAERGIVLQNCTAEHAVIEPGSVSCIVMTNVFEHLHDPVGVLRICREALQPDGLLVLSVPNHDCWAARAFGSAWPGYDAPRHLWGFSPRTIAPFLAQHGSRVDRIYHRTTARWSWLSCLDGRHASKPPAGWRPRWAQPLSYALMRVGFLASMLGNSDFVKVVARRERTDGAA